MSEKLIDIKFAETAAASSMTTEIAVRSRTPDWMMYFGYLPDPDLVLSKLGAALSTYKQLLTDAHVWACYSARKAAVMSCEWDIREKQGGGSRANKKAVTLIEEVLDGLDMDRVLSDMLDAPFYGMSPMEVIWTAAGGTGGRRPEVGGSEIFPASRWIPERIEGKPPDWFVFGLENDLRFLSRDEQIEGEKLPEKKFILPRHHPTYENPYGERLAARCFWPVAFKKGGLKYWAVFTEKYGMPWVVGRVPRRTNETERAALLANLITMVQDAAAVINDDERIELVEQKGKEGSANIYAGLVDAANKEISKAILGQTATTEGTPGKLGEEKGQVETKKDLVDKDKRMVKQQMDMLFQWVVSLNLGGAAAPELVWQEEEDIQADRAERDGKLHEQGVRFRKDYYVRAYGFEDTDLEVTEQGAEAGGQRSEVGGQGSEVGDQGAEDGARGTEFQKSVRVRFRQEEADRIAFEAAKASQEAVAALIEPVLREIEGAASFEEMGERIYAMYPEMDSKLFQDLLARAMFAGSAVGYAAAGEDE